jgi:hypothetical protein
MRERATFEVYTTLSITHDMECLYVLLLPPPSLAKTKGEGKRAEEKKRSRQGGLVTVPTTKYRPLLVCSRLSQRSSSSRKSRQKNPKSITKLLIKHGNGRRTDTPALFLDAVVLVAFPHQKKNSSREESGELLEHEHE